MFRKLIITEVSEVMKPMYRNGLKGHQHIAQGIALGRRTIVKFALKGHKPYVIDAVNKGIISEERINQSVRRILKLKQ